MNFHIHWGTNSKELEAERGARMYAVRHLEQERERLTAKSMEERRQIETQTQVHLYDLLRLEGEKRIDL